MFPDNGLFSTPQHLGLLLSDAGGHFVTVFANGPVLAEITLPMADSYEVLRSGADLGSLAGGRELLRREAAQITRLPITGSVDNGIVTVLNSGTAVDTPIVFSGRSGDDVLMRRWQPVRPVWPGTAVTTR